MVHHSRPMILVTSAVLVLLLLGGGFAVKVGAGESSYGQVVLFSDVLSLVMENYVDPVEMDRLLRGAYEGMLGGLDANGAYLTREEVTEWKARQVDPVVDPGVTVLKAGSALQVVEVEPGSAAARAGVEVGDHVRSIDGRPVRDLSLEQSMRLLRGVVGSTVRLDLYHVGDEFRQETVEVPRQRRHAPPHELTLRDGVAILRIRHTAGLDVQRLGTELAEARSQGIDELLLDLRNLADEDPRSAAPVAGLFASGTLMQLRDRAGRLIESLQSESGGKSWPGAVALLVNGATAGSGEALASAVHTTRGALLLGESTYGLGAQPKLYELESGDGLLISAAVWEDPAGDKWNGKGLEPDEVIHGQGEGYPAIAADQLERTLAFLRARRAQAEPARPAA